MSTPTPAAAAPAPTTAAAAAPAAPAPAPATPAAPALNLKDVDVVLCVDTSGSMRTADAGSQRNLKRLKAVEETACAVAEELLPFDSDGITVVRFAGSVDLADGCKGSAAIEKIFQEYRPMGSTDTHGALSEVFKKFPPGSTKKPLCVVVFTDGAPDNPAAVAQLIVDTTKKIKSRNEVGILFVQVGDDAEATEYLAKLDNQLTSAGAAHDIVAVTRIERLEKLSTQDIVKLAFTK